MEGVHAEVGEGLDDGGVERVGEGGDRGEGEGAADVGGQDGEPETRGGPEVAALGEDEGDGVEGVLGEELSATEDDDDEAEGVEEFGDELGFGRGAEKGQRDGVTEGGEAHEDATGEAGEGECDGGAHELFAGALGDLLEDLLGAGTGEVLLRSVDGLLGLFAAEADGHAGPFVGT